MREIEPVLNGARLRIAVVRGRFNEAIGAGLLAACLSLSQFLINCKRRLTSS